MSDRHEGRLEKAVAELEHLTRHRPMSYLCDVTEQADVDSLISFAERELVHIDVLVNNAGFGGQKQVVDMADEEWLGVIDVNLNGTFRMTRAALRHMFRNRAGSIVNLSSVLGWRSQTEQ